MGDLIGFPRGPKVPPPRDVWDLRTRELDEGYVLEVLKTRLPAEALRHVAGLDLASTARAVLLEIDTVRDKRRFDQDDEERQGGGDLGALDRMFTRSPPPELSPPEPEGAA